MKQTQRVSEVLAAVSTRLRPPRGHREIDLESYLRLTWPHTPTDLPPGQAGWVTTQVGSQHFAAWVPAPKDGAGS